MPVIRHTFRYGGMLLVLALILVLSIPLEPDIDIWFLLASGRTLDILPTIPMQDPLTLHSGLDFCMEQWLTAYFFWHAQQFFSLNGLVVIVFLVGLFTGICYLRLAMQETPNFLLAGIVTLFTMRILGPFLTTRPQIFSYLLFTLAFLLLEHHAKSGGGKKALWVGLPVISMLLINLHAGFFPMLICLFLPYLLESLMKNVGPFSRNPHLHLKILLPVMALVFLAALCNPYGMNAITFAASGLMSGYHAASIEEMAPLSIQQQMAIPVLILVVLLVWGYTRRHIPYRYLFLSCGTLFLTLLMQRGAALFFLFSGFQLAYFFRDAEDASVMAFLKKPFIQFLLAGTFLAMVAAQDGDAQSLFLGLLIFPLLFFWNRLPEDVQPCAFLQVLAVFSLGTALVFLLLPPALHNVPPGSQAAFRALSERTVSPSSIRLYCGYNDGGYAEYLGIRPYIDGRAEVFLPQVNHQKDIFKEWHDVKAGRIYYKDFLARYDFNYLLVRQDDALYYALPHDAGYRMVYEQDGIRLFEKVGEGIEDFTTQL